MFSAIHAWARSAKRPKFSRGGCSASTSPPANSQPEVMELSQEVNPIAIAFLADGRPEGWEGSWRRRERAIFAQACLRLNTSSRRA